MDILNKIIQLLTTTIKENYMKSQKKTLQKRYKGISNGYYKILQIINDNFIDDATEYYKKCRKNDKKLVKIQNDVINSIKKYIDTYSCSKNIKYLMKSGSSFSAKTNLLNDSDIDIDLLIKDFNDDKFICISNMLGNNNFLLHEIVVDEKRKYYVFTKVIDKTDIEIKMINYDTFKETLKIHYIDNKINTKEKILITYAKYILKNYDKKYYDLFKIIYYANAGYKAKINELIYKLI